MTGKRKRAALNAKRLAKSVSKSKTVTRSGRARKDPLRKKPGRDPGRAMGDERDVSPLIRLMGAFRAEKIRFQLIGMAAAVVQGVPVATFDVDFWLDLPVGKYMQAALNANRRNK